MENNWIAKRIGIEGELELDDGREGPVENNWIQRETGLELQSLSKSAIIIRDRGPRNKTERDCQRVSDPGAAGQTRVARERDSINNDHRTIAYIKRKSTL